jgi:hypothetical protein
LPVAVGSLFTAAALVAGLAACSGSGSSSAKVQLEKATQQVRDAAAKGTFSELKQAVRQLDDVVASEESSGELSVQAGQLIQDDAQAVLTAATPAAPPPTTPTPTTTSPTPITPTTAVTTPTEPPTTAATSATPVTPTTPPTTPTTPTTPATTPTTTDSKHGPL